MRTTSKTGTKHPYYMCFAKGCERYRKSIKRDAIEGAFGELLDGLTPAPGLIELAFAMFKDAWKQRAVQATAIAREYAQEIAKVEKQIAALFDRIVEAGSGAVIAAYERRVEQLERGKLRLAESREKTTLRQGTFEELFEFACQFLANPSKLWRSDRLEDKRLALRLTFAGNLAYDPKTGFRTPKVAMPFNMLRGNCSDKSRLAERVGFKLCFDRAAVAIKTGLQRQTLQNGNF